MFVAHIIATPLLLALGFLIAPRGLSLLSEAALREIEPAMQVGAAWLALLVGMRGARPRLTKKYIGFASFAGVTALVTWVGVAVVAWGALTMLGLSNQGLKEIGGTLPVIGASLLCAGLVSTTGLELTHEALQNTRPSLAHDMLRFLCRHDEIIGALALLVAMWLWPRPVATAPIYADPLVAVASVVGLAILLAIVQVLLGEDRDKLIGRIALVGLITLAAGLTSTMGVPGVALGFFFGVLLGLSGVGGQFLEEGVGSTYRPVRLVLVILIGANLGFTIGAVLLGGALAAARALFKSILRAYLRSRYPKAELPFSALLASGGTTIPFALSFAMSQPGSLQTSEVLTAVAIAVSLTDLVTLIAWRQKAWTEEAESSVVKARVRIAAVTTTPAPEKKEKSGAQVAAKGKPKPTTSSPALPRANVVSKTKSSSSTTSPAKKATKKTHVKAETTSSTTVKAVHVAPKASSTSHPTAGDDEKEKA